MTCCKFNAMEQFVKRLASRDYFQVILRRQLATYLLQDGCPKSPLVRVNLLLLIRLILVLIQVVKLEDGFQGVKSGIAIQVRFEFRCIPELVDNNQPVESKPRTAIGKLAEDFHQARSPQSVTWVCLELLKTLVGCRG